MEALRRAKESWPSNDTVKRYLSSIKLYAKQDEFDVLYVIDNGKGFDDKGLEAVLAEGSPEKPDGSSGSFGIGHLTTFAISGLQYVFYIGKKEDGSMVAAGHAIMSSFADEEGTQRSHHGYFVGDYQHTFFSPYEFCYGSSENKQTIPQFLWEEAKKIEGSGSIVAVLGFKGFEDESGKESDEQQISKAIRKAVAENFAMAICSGDLTIQVEDADGTRKSVDKSSILEFLDWMALPETGTREETKNAKTTLEEIVTYQDCLGRNNLPWEYQQHLHKANLPEPFQDCQVFLRNRSTTHNVSVWRNGMLITRKHVGLSKSMFDGKKPLNAVILLSGQQQPRKAHDLVKKSETPLHDRIVERRLDRKEDREELRSLLKSIRDWIFDHAEDSGGESITLDDEILIDAGSETIRPSPTRPRPEPGPKPGPRPEPGPGPRPPKLPPKPTKPRPDLARVQGRPDAKNGNAETDRYFFRVLPNRKAADAFMECLVDTGQDPACVGVIKAQEIEAQEIYGCSDAVKSNLSVDEGMIRIANMEKDVPIEFGVVFDGTLAEGISLNCRFAQAASAKDQD